jgi:hypothetical protein
VRFEPDLVACLPEDLSQAPVGLNRTHLAHALAVAIKDGNRDKEHEYLLETVYGYADDAETKRLYDSDKYTKPPGKRHASGFSRLIPRLVGENGIGSNGL